MHNKIEKEDFVEKDEMVNHMINECSKLAQNDFMTWYDWLGIAITWYLCKRWRCDYNTKMYWDKPVSVFENKSYNL